MQRINVVIVNPRFLAVFMGTSLLAVVCVVTALLSWSATRSTWMLAAGLLYLVGSFFVTAAFNVPRNQRLASLDAQSSEAAAYWRVYLQEWTTWNHVRTAASLASAACAAMALAY